MKKIMLFLLALMPVLLFTACSSDDDESGKESEKWSMLDLDLSKRSSFVGEWYIGDYERGYFSDDEVLVINQDGTAIRRIGVRNYKGTYTFSNATITYRSGDGDLVRKYSFSHYNEEELKVDVEHTIVFVGSTDKYSYIARPTNYLRFYE